MTDYIPHVGREFRRCYQVDLDAALVPVTEATSTTLRTKLPQANWRPLPYPNLSRWQRLKIMLGDKLCDLGRWFGGV
jgi:hypothetical protein